MPKRCRRSTSASSSSSGLNLDSKELEKKRAKAVAKAAREQGSRSSLGAKMVRLQDAILHVRGAIPEYFTALKRNNAQNSGLDWKKEGVIDGATETIYALAKDNEELKDELRRVYAQLERLQLSNSPGPRL
ncbi:hypothetical protein BDV96DRAFT_644107 [Lophiotrema nucula]|uniref:Uncharacterized protein n=1 Tax=Lophiotrema nucula TaxID=690887 RepID=A0A6A5ZGB2_9PLEO|nr:hypothetical protein BDV96DRAFT_644107 [Lophiotrema nucula]